MKTKIFFRPRHGLVAGLGSDTVRDQRHRLRRSRLLLPKAAGGARSTSRNHWSERVEKIAGGDTLVTFSTI